MRRLRLTALIALLLTWLAPAAGAQAVGSIASIDGSAEIGRAGAWTPAVIGATVGLHDELRTGRPGRLCVVLQDDSVLNIGDDSHLVIEEQVFDPAKGTFRTVIRLLQGKVRPLVSAYYERPKALYEIETPTAVVRVHGTEFVITYDPVAEVSDVVGVAGRVSVNSVRDRIGHTVFITAQESTRVARGKFPTPPQRLPDRLFRQYIEGLEFIGGGRAISLTTGNAVLKGASVPPPDRAGAQPGPAVSAAPSIIPSLPGEPAFESRTVGDALGQPPSSVGLGDLGIRF